MVRYCAVYGCLQNTFSNRNRRLFRFPFDEQRCKQWIKAIGRIDLENKDVNTLHTSYYVCELHFVQSDCPKKYLKRDVVPTLLLPQLEEPSGTSKYTQTEVNLSTITSKCSQTDINLSRFPRLLQHISIPVISKTSQSVQTDSTLSKVTSRKTKLQMEIKSEFKKPRLLESIPKNVKNTKDSDLPPLLKKVIDAQKVLKTNSQGNRYDHVYMMFALNIYFASPIAYRFLSETLCLPNKRTLQRRMAFGITTKFDENVIKCLQSKSRNLSDCEKYCIICADEISLKRHLYYQINKDKVVGFHEINEKQSKEIATQAFVVMARGIYSNWKQPLAFCFLNQSRSYPELDMWLENIMAKMIEIGFNVCAFTSDQGTNFINMAKNKSVSPDKPFFFVNGKKIYYIFDVPHLTKSLRNNLINHDFVYDDDDGSKQVASWNDIKQMYDIEKNKRCKIAFKLTESHIKPNNFEKTRVKYATQVMSRTVAATICTLVDSGILHEKSIGTKDFIELINNTFDILNSYTVNNDYKYKKAFSQAEYQLNTLEKAQRIFSGLRVLNRSNGKDVTNTMKFIKGFLISIKAITNLASDLKAAGYKNLFIRRLNMDPLENFFLKVRQQGGHYCEPTAIQFITAFKKLFMFNVIKHSEYANCAKDLDQILMSAEDAQSSLRSNENVSIESIKRILHVGTPDYRFELPEANAFTYVCGYLLKKCYDNHYECEVMKNYIKIKEQVDGNNHFIHFEAGKTDFLFPPEDFKQYIRQLDNICVDHFINCDFYRVGNEIMSKLGETEFCLPCPCFPLEYLKKLFVRFRIFNVMRHNNKNFRDKSFEKKFFNVPHLLML